MSIHEIAELVFGFGLIFLACLGAMFVLGMHCIMKVRMMDLRKAHDEYASRMKTDGWEDR